MDGDGGFSEILPEDGSTEGRVIRPVRGDSQREATDEVRTVDSIPRLQGDRNVHPTIAASFNVFRPDQKGGGTESSAEVSIDQAVRRGVGVIHPRGQETDKRRGTEAEEDRPPEEAQEAQDARRYRQRGGRARRGAAGRGRTTGVDGDPASVFTVLHSIIGPAQHRPRLRRRIRLRFGRVRCQRGGLERSGRVSADIVEIDQDCTVHGYTAGV